MASPLEIDCRWNPSGSGETVRGVLGTLPQWFGIPEALAGYVAEAERSPTLIATVERRVVGVLTLVRHSPDAAEIYLMAVLPECHRAGVGRRLVNETRRSLQAESVRFLQVKTLSSRHPDAGYTKTRAFYEAMGFTVLEEFPNLWGPAAPAVQLVTYLPRVTAR